MDDRYGSILYPREFVAGLPKPDAHETRHLLLLLRDEHRDPHAEIERIERWFRELDSPIDRKNSLKGNLRSLKSRNFWSALCELMTSRVFTEYGYTASFERPIAGLTPDFDINYGSQNEFIVEVMTVFKEEEHQHRDDDLHYVANGLAQIKLRIPVLIDEVELPENRPSLKPLIKRVSAWLDTLGGNEPATLSLTSKEVGLSVTLSTMNIRPQSAPIVGAIIGSGGKISTHEIILNGLRRKSIKCRSIKEAGLPLVIFVWQGAWLHVSATSLEWALFGQDRFVITRTREGIKNTNWDRAPGGLFGFGSDGSGDPQHTRISAVMYCERVWQEGKVYARMQLYHHPFAAKPLPMKLFEEVPQCIPVEATREQVRLNWIKEPGGYTLLLR